MKRDRNSSKNINTDLPTTPSGNTPSTGCSSKPIKFDIQQSENSEHSEGNLPETGGQTETGG